MRVQTLENLRLSQHLLVYTEKGRLGDLFISKRFLVKSFFLFIFFI